LGGNLKAQKNADEALQNSLKKRPKKKNEKIKRILVDFEG
jgi:hypothetical protein